MNTLHLLCLIKQQTHFNAAASLCVWYSRIWFLPLVLYVYGKAPCVCLLHCMYSQLSPFFPLFHQMYTQFYQTLELVKVIVCSCLVLWLCCSVYPCHSLIPGANQKACWQLHCFARLQCCLVVCLF